MLFRANFAGVDSLIVQAVRRRGLTGDLELHRSEPAVTLDELMREVQWSGPAETQKVGRVAGQQAGFVYAVCAWGGPEFGGKMIWGVDVWQPPGPGARTAYLAVGARGTFESPILVPMPELPAVLLTGAGTVLDSRAAFHAVIKRVSDTPRMSAQRGCCQIKLTTRDPRRALLSGGGGHTVARV